MKKATGVLVPGLLGQMDAGWRAASEAAPTALPLYIYIYAFSQNGAQPESFPEMSACKLGKYQ